MVLSQYKIEQTPLEKVEQYHLGLQKDPYFKNFAHSLMQDLIFSILQNFPQVQIKDPFSRLKSPHSCANKAKNLEIERLSKLYFLNSVCLEDIEELFSLFRERIYEKKLLDKSFYLTSLKAILTNQFPEDKFAIFENCFLLPNTVSNRNGGGELSPSTKTALLRMVYHNIESSSTPNTELLDYIQKNYGMDVTNPDKDILQYDSIDRLFTFPEKREALHNVVEFLKCKDLRGGEIILSDVADNFVTTTPALKELLEKRKNSHTKEEYSNYDKQCLNLVSQDIMDFLTLPSSPLLQKLHVEILPHSRKYKNKANGYVAAHIKFVALDNPNYTFELQIKSHYVEEIAKYGTAAHDKRPGKQRNLPDMSDTVDSTAFKRSLDFLVPKFTLFEKESNYAPYDFSLLTSCMKYYTKQINNHHSDGVEFLYKYASLFQDTLNFSSQEYNPLFKVSKELCK